MFDGFGAFHFASPGWLWALFAPILVGVWLALTIRKAENARIRDYADAHLLPHLMGSRELGPKGKWQRFARWVALWSLVVLAMAGPRWDYTDVQLVRPGGNLVVIVDISRSMAVTDVRPSRLARARQELEDLLRQSQGLRIGVIAFASVAHVIAPVTEDMHSIHRILPALSTDLGKLQGSRLSSALERARQLTEAQPEGNTNALLLITDGDFAEPDLKPQIKALASKGIQLHVLGIGTLEGGEVPGPNGRTLLDVNRNPVRSRLDETLLRSLAQAGGGVYERADYYDSDTEKILSRVKKQTSFRTDRDSQARVWHEEFFWLAGIVLLFILPQFRRIRLLSPPKPQRVTP
jgi:Ca-activated chloride channel family protein